MVAESSFERAKRKLQVKSVWTRRRDEEMFSCRLIEVSLANQINPLPFHLHIWSNRSSMDELENCSNRYYHLEEISPDEIDLGKEAELIPVAHYTKVMSRRNGIRSPSEMFRSKENVIQINLQKFFPFLLKVIHVRSIDLTS